MNLLYVIGSLGLGGAERQLYLLAKNVKQHGHDVSVFALDASGPLKEDFEGEGINVVGGGFDSGTGSSSRVLSYLSLVASFIRLLIYIAPRRFHIVHAFLPLTNFMGSIAGRSTGARVITSRRGLGTHQKRGLIWRWMDKVSNKLSHVVTVNSLGVWDDVVARDGINPKKLKLIYNGLDFDRFERLDCAQGLRKELGISDGEIVIVNVANLIPYKGHEVLIHAFAKASQQVGKLKLFLIGEDRGIGQNLKNLVDELGIKEQVHFFGYQKQPERFLVASDISVVSSFEEGFCNFLIESMYAKNYTIATTVGGNAEALAGGDFGTLVPPGDSGKMSDALVKACINSADRADKSHQSHQSVKENYTVERMVGEHLSIYQLDSSAI